VVYAANALAHRYAEEGDKTLELAAEPPLTGLGLSDVWLAQTDAQSSRLLDHAEKLVVN
jgi:hypothetical protein